MVAIRRPCELELTIVPDFDLQTVPDPDEDADTPDASGPEEAPLSWEPTFDGGDAPLMADAGRERDDSDDDDAEFDDLDDEPDDDDLADDDDDDDDDLDDDLDDDRDV
jgi:hypothetical protein